MQRLSDWAIDLEKARLVKLRTYHGKAGVLTLLPRLPIDDAGLVTIYNKNGNTIYEVSDELLEALTKAYKEAAGKEIEI